MTVSFSVKDKEDGPMDSEVRPMKDETFGEYRFVVWIVLYVFMERLNS